MRFSINNDVWSCIQVGDKAANCLPLEIILRGICRVNVCVSELNIIGKERGMT
jgi:hypothetical protein